ncbi:c-type cytochrome [Deinococcus sp. VB142]|uniref:C-type cytochrome n=1 Tax=Deinococcus sp. VB142 TaxID=3112952 RepID=A0AAU6Q1E6_9DEIO
MKNTFAVTMTLLLALTIGGSIAGYRIATTPQHEASAAHGAKGGEEGAATTHDATTTESPAAEEATGTEATPTANTDTSTATDGVNNAGSTSDTNDNEPGTTGNTPENMAAAQADTNAASADGDAAAGAEKYAASCAGCHGANAEGGVGPALAVVKDWSLEDFTTALREGRAPGKTLSPVMPRFVATQVSDQDIANIQAHLKGL